MVKTGQNSEKTAKTAKNDQKLDHRNTSHTLPVEVINVRVPHLMK